MTYPICLNTTKDVYRFYKLAHQEDYNLYISTDRGHLNAKSLLALFTVIGQEVNIVAPDHANSEQFVEFVNKVKKQM